MFETKFELAYHSKKHSEERQFECPICLKKFKHQVTLKQHMSTHSEPSVAVFSCEKCGVNFRQKKNYLAHLRSVHQRQSRFACIFCDKVFSRKAGLRDHLIKAHNTDFPTQDEIRAQCKADALIPPVLKRETIEQLKNSKHTAGAARSLLSRLQGQGLVMATRSAANPSDIIISHGALPVDDLSQLLRPTASTTFTATSSSTSEPLTVHSQSSSPASDTLLRLANTSQQQQSVTSRDGVTHLPMTTSQRFTGNVLSAAAASNPLSVRVVNGKVQAFCHRPAAVDMQQRRLLVANQSAFPVVTTQPLSRHPNPQFSIHNSTSGLVVPAALPQQLSAVNIGLASAADLGFGRLPSPGSCLSEETVSAIDTSETLSVTTLPGGDESDKFTIDLSDWTLFSSLMKTPDGKTTAAVVSSPEHHQPLQQLEGHSYSPLSAAGLQTPPRRKPPTIQQLLAASDSQRQTGARQRLTLPMLSGGTRAAVHVITSPSHVVKNLNQQLSVNIESDVTLDDTGNIPHLSDSVYQPLEMSPHTITSTPLRSANDVIGLPPLPDPLFSPPLKPDHDVTDLAALLPGTAFSPPLLFQSPVHTLDTHPLVFETPSPRMRHNHDPGNLTFTSIFSSSSNSE